MQSAGKPSLNRKRQILDHLLNELNEQYWEFIEVALESSDMQESKTYMKYLMEKK
jgi:hypothetical protein